MSLKMSKIMLNEFVGTLATDITCDGRVDGTGVAEALHDGVAEKPDEHGGGAGFDRERAPKRRVSSCWYGKGGEKLLNY